MLFELRSEIRQTIESCCEERNLREGILQALSCPGFALNPQSRCMAGLLTLKVYEAICGKFTTAAIKAAVAVELYMEAAYIFDDIADGEIDSTGDMSVAEELPIAIGLMNCGVIVACEAGKQTGSDSRGLRALLELQKNCLKSCSGQFMDVRLQKFGSVTTDDALDMTCRKSGSLGRLAAAQGAIMATDESDIIGLFEEFGFNLSSYIQLIDDMRDACPQDGNMRDMQQYKKTLPLAYFYNYLLQEHAITEYDIIPSLYDEQVRRDIQHKFRTSGADTFCAIVAETYLNRAKNILVTLKDRVRTVEGLEHYVNSLEISPDEISAVV